MVYMGCPIKSRVGLFGLVKLVGQRVRLRTGGDKKAAEAMIRYAHENGYIDAGELVACHALLSEDVAIAQAVRIVGIDQ